MQTQCTAVLALHFVLLFMVSYIHAYIYLCCQYYVVYNDDCCPKGKCSGRKCKRREKNRVAAQNSRRKHTKKADLLHQVCLITSLHVSLLSSETVQYIIEEYL